MAEYTIDSATLTAIANAIRAKTGDSAALSPEEMRDVIRDDLQYPVGDMTIISNGDYDVSDCASVHVEVESGVEPSPGDLLSYDWNEATLTLTVVEREADSSDEEEEPGEVENNLGEEENAGEEENP